MLLRAEHVGWESTHAKTRFYFPAIGPEFRDQPSSHIFEAHRLEISVSIESGG